jgi:hypothetical protein
MMTDAGHPRNVPTADAHGCLTRDGVPRLIRREAGVMVTEAPPRADSQVARSYHHRAFGLLKDLERPRDMFRDLGPNWFATVMGIRGRRQRRSHLAGSHDWPDRASPPLGDRDQDAPGEEPGSRCHVSCLMAPPSGSCAVETTVPQFGRSASRSRCAIRSCRRCPGARRGRSHERVLRFGGLVGLRMCPGPRR